MKPDETTVRLSRLEYIDREGNQKAVEAPGWVGMVPYMPDDFSFILGQLYIERPSADFLSTATAFTVAKLRSVDRMQVMLQEFEGITSERAQIEELVRGRLGPEISAWHIVEASAFRRSG